MNTEQTSHTAADYAFRFLALLAGLLLLVGVVVAVCSDHAAGYGDTLSLTTSTQQTLVLSLTDATTLVCLLFFVSVALTMVLFFLALNRNHVKDIRLVYLALFLINAALYAFSDSDLGFLFGWDSDALSYLSYLFFMTLPIAPLGYTFRSLSGQYCQVLWAELACLVSICIQMTLDLSGVAPLSALLPLNYCLLLIAIGSMLWCSFVDWRSEGNDHARILFFANLFVLVVMLASLAVYWLVDTSTYRLIMLLGIAVYLVVPCYEMIYSYTMVVVRRESEQQELRLYQHLSTYDALTGLQNRRAFEDHMQRIEALESPDNCLLVILDVNGLKFTNDTFGHAAGDDLIVQASAAIQEAYGPDGTCYRIGGDEFAVVFERTPANIDALHDKLSEQEQRCNEEREYTLSIAHGSSSLYAVTGSRKRISDWKQEADVRMYRNKLMAATARNAKETRALRHMIDFLIDVEEAKDPLTTFHSDRVQALSGMLARHLGLSTEAVGEIEEAARLHDIGKIGINDAVLTKPGPLNEREWTAVEQHSVLGARILEQSAGMATVAKIVLHHHERFDGRGYPDHLAGDDIPLGSRIIAIADGIDTLTSLRCYREPVGLDECHGEILACSGNRYDPALVQLALEHWDEVIAIVLSSPNDLLSARLGVIPSIPECKPIVTD